MIERYSMAWTVRYSDFTGNEFHTSAIPGSPDSVRTMFCPKGVWSKLKDRTMLTSREAMRRSLSGTTGWLLCGAALFLAGTAIGCAVGRLSGGSEKTLMHVFAYTPTEGSTMQNFDAFKKATIGMIGQVPGLKRVWVGKLREP